MSRSDPDGDVIIVAADEADRDVESLPRLWRRRLRRVFQLLVETADPTTMRTDDLTSAELAKQNSFESIDYYKAYPDIYIEHLRERHELRCAYESDVASSSCGSINSGNTDANRSKSSQTLSDPQDTNSSNIHTTSNHNDAVHSIPAAHLPHSARPFLCRDDESSHIVVRWLLHVYIAVAVALVASVVSITVELIAYYRKHTLTTLLTHFTVAPLGWLAGWCWWSGVSCLLLALSAGVVVYFEPTAAGGGIPDVMAYLNGVYMPRAIHLCTFAAKAMSCVCAVAGGLPVGLEAPLIHLGAITGAGVTQGRSRTLGWKTNLFRGFRNNKDRRDFITAGAACGVSAAFGAPIGGLLFVMEEVSSFWDHSSSGQILLATLVCFSVISILTAVLSRSEFMHPVDDVLGVLFEINIKIPLNVVSILPSIVLGAMLGVLAALFTKANILLIKWRRGWATENVGHRDRSTSPHLAQRSRNDNHGSLSEDATRASPYRGTDKPEQDRSSTESAAAAAAAGRCFNPGQAAPMCDLVGGDGLHPQRAQLSPRTARFLEPILLVFVYTSLTYCLTLLAPCTDILSSSHARNDTVLVWGTESGTHTSLFNATCHTSNTYSSFGTLHLTSGKNSIRHLFSRQTAGAFSVLTLTCFVLLYTCFACLSNGAAVSGGLVVPSLAIGAGFGRLFGLLLWHCAARSVDGIDRGYAADSAWLDPGVFALVGAGAFLAGTSRLTISVSVIMVELSAELNYLLPVMAAIVMARIVADRLCEPLYNHMLRSNCVPYLPSELPMREFEELTAADIMASRVTTLRTRERSAVIARALRETTHHAFPVLQWVPSSDGCEQTGKGVAQGYSNRAANLYDTSAGGVDGTDTDKMSTVQKDRNLVKDADDAMENGSAGRRRRYKFVGLITREDLLAYFALPHLCTSSTRTANSSGRVHNSDNTTDGKEVDNTAHTDTQACRDSGGGGGGARAVNDMTWTEWYRHKAVLFLGHGAHKYINSSGATPNSNDSNATSSRDVSIMDDAALRHLPAVVDLSRFVNRSPWVIPAFFNCHMVYQTFRMMGLRHMVVVDGEDVCGIITRKDLLVDTLRRRMKELRRRVDAERCTRSTLPGRVCHEECKYNSHCSIHSNSERNHSDNIYYCSNDTKRENVAMGYEVTRN